MDGWMVDGMRADRLKDGWMANRQTKTLKDDSTGPRLVDGTEVDGWVDRQIDDRTA